MPAERFHEHGYRTIGIWRNGWVSPTFGFGQGFEIYHRPVPGRATAAFRRSQMLASNLPGTDLDATRSAIEFLRGVGRRPFFLYIHYMDAHQYVSADSSPNFGTRFEDLYDSAIHWTDQNLGLLIDALDAEGLREKTLVLVASDHGEGLGERGLEGHARGLERETQETPLVIGLPFALDPGVVVDEPIANVDLWPTVFDLLDLSEPDLAPRLDGRSVVPLIRRASGQNDPDAASLRGRTLVAQLDRSWGRQERASRPMASATRDGLRLLWHREEPGSIELRVDSRLPADEGVNHSLPEIAEEEASALQSDLRAILARDPLWSRAEAVVIDRDERIRLRALGYALTEGVDVDSDRSTRTIDPDSAAP